MYVEQIEISNIRCFGTARLAFVHPEGTIKSWHDNVTVLLGDNGSGKTTVLRAIAIASLGELGTQSGLVPYELVRRTTHERRRSGQILATLRLHGHEDGLPDNRLTSLVFKSKVVVEKVGDQEILKPDWGKSALASLRSPNDFKRALYRDRSSSLFVVGYSAQRTLGSERRLDGDMFRKPRRLRYRRVAGLFEDDATLFPLAAWLHPLRRNRARFQEVVTLINTLLPGDVKLTRRFRDDQFIFRDRGCDVLGSALSDGYRAYLGWVTDLLYNLVKVCPADTNLSAIPGVVLIDEIDLHLHPAWQRTVLPALSGVFPNLQFIVTTHSPIVAGTVSSKNIYVMHATPDGAVAADQLTEPIHGRNADQILLSRYFALKTTRAPGFIDELDRIAARARGGDLGAAFEAIQRLTSGSETLDVTSIHGDHIASARTTRPSLRRRRRSRR